VEFLEIAIWRDRKVAVTLRLARHGQKKRPFYRIVAAEKTARRDGRYLEIIGTYNPMVNPPAVALKEDKIRRWVNDGAQQSQLVRSLIKKNIPGLIEERETAKLKKIQDRRKKRKTALQAKTPKAASPKKEKKKAKAAPAKA